MKTYLTTLFLLVFAYPLFSQWAPINPIDFNTDTYRTLSGGKSYFKFKKGEIYASKDGMVKEFYVRAHILDEEGLEELSKVSLYYLRSKDIIKNIRGRSINYENGELVKTPLSSKEIFTNKKVKDLSEVLFVLPKAKIGSIIEYKYTLVEANYFSTTWYFQAQQPVLYSEVSFTAGADFHYQPLIQGFRQDEIVRNVRQESATFFQKDIPAALDEAFVPNLNDYLSKVMFQLSGINAGGSIQPIFKDWDDLTKSLLDNPQVGTLRKASKKLYNKVLPKLELPEDPYQRMVEICSHVHEQVEWNGYHNLTARESRKPEEIYESGSGNSGEINIVLTSLLKSAGLEVIPMLVSTIDNGGAIKVFPFANQFNHLVALVKIKEKEYVLDACQTYSNYSLPPENILGQEAWKLSRTYPGWFKIKAEVLSQSYITCELSLSEEEDLEGKFSEIYIGYPEQRLFEAYSEDEDEFWKVYHEGQDLTVEDGSLNKKKGGVSISYTTRSSDWIERIGDLLVLDVFKPWRIEKNPFSEEDRVFPIDLSYPYIFRKAIILKIPEGYAIESFPKPSAVSLPNKAISFAMTSLLMNEGKMLKIETLFKVQRVYYNNKEVDMLRQIFDQQLIKESETIVLKKL